jgi:hypothetical protein
MLWLPVAFCLYVQSARTISESRQNRLRWRAVEPTSKTARAIGANQHRLRIDSTFKGGNPETSKSQRSLHQTGEEL